MNLKNEPIIKEYINNLSNITYDKKCFKHNNFYLKTLYKQNLFEIKAILFPQKSSKLDIWNKIGIIQLYFNHSLVDEFHISHSSKENVLLEGFSFFSLENIMSGKEKIDENTHILKPFLVEVFTLAYCRFLNIPFLQNY